MEKNELILFIQQMTIDKTFTGFKNIVSSDIELKEVKVMAVRFALISVEGFNQLWVAVVVQYNGVIGESWCQMFVLWLQGVSQNMEH